MSNQKARERADILLSQLAAVTGRAPAKTELDLAERAITAAEQAAREDERRKLVVIDEDALDREIEAGYQAAFRRGAEWMREQLVSISMDLGHALDRAPLRERVVLLRDAAKLDPPAAPHADAPEPGGAG